MTIVNVMLDVHFDAEQIVACPIRPGSMPRVSRLEG